MRKVLRRKIKTFLILSVAFTFVFVGNAKADQKEAKGMVYGEEHILTRAEWIHDLVIMFNMSLDNGAFAPGKSITTAEVQAMYDDAVKLNESTVIDTEYNNKFKLAKGVIGLPATYIAKKVVKNPGSIVITSEETDKGIEDIDAQGIVEYDNAEFEPADGVEYEITEEESQVVDISTADVTVVVMA